MFSLKSVAIAAVVIVATAGASMAATYAYVDNDANVHKHHGKAYQVVNQVWEGQQVKVVGEWKSWVKVQIPGKDGWVKKSNLDFAYYDWNDDYYNGKVCLNGQYGSLCFQN
jgi:uncharacterized protein YgiM (DUF1202 family)